MEHPFIIPQDTFFFLKWNMFIFWISLEKTCKRYLTTLELFMEQNTSNKSNQHSIQQDLPSTEACLSILVESEEECSTNTSGKTWQMTNKGFSYHWSWKEVVKNCIWKKCCGQISICHNKHSQLENMSINLYSTSQGKIRGCYKIKGLFTDWKTGTTEYI